MGHRQLHKSVSRLCLALQALLLALLLRLLREHTRAVDRCGVWGLTPDSAQRPLYEAAAPTATARAMSRHLWWLRLPPAPSLGRGLMGGVCVGEY